MEIEIGDVILTFDNGKFDKWCVYKIENGKRYAPKDKDYFEEILYFVKKYGVNTFYRDFVKLYKRTNKGIEPSVLRMIKLISIKYEENKQMEILLTILYMGMIAEENKKNTKLGKRIKRLGVYTLLFEGMDLDYSVNYMKNKSWIEIDKLCTERGF